MLNYPKNAKYSLIVEPMWAMFGGLIFFCVPIYMKELGLTEIQMGIINTCNMLVGFLCFLLAAPITNRFGRKRTTLVVDLISWGIPMALWAITWNFWVFFIASSINGLSKITMVAWTCLVMEDTPVEKRASFYGIINVMVTMSGLLTPLTALFFTKFGTVTTMRALYATGFVSMVSMFIIRNALVDETSVGKELMLKHQSLSITDSIKDTGRTLVRIFRHKDQMLFAILFILSNFIVSFGFFTVLFLRDKVQLSD